MEALPYAECHITSVTLLQHDDITLLPHASTMSSCHCDVAINYSVLFVFFKAGWIATTSIFCL